MRGFESEARFKTVGWVGGYNSIEGRLKHAEPHASPSEVNTKIRTRDRMKSSAERSQIQSSAFPPRSLYQSYGLSKGHVCFRITSGYQPLLISRSACHQDHIFPSPIIWARSSLVGRGQAGAQLAIVFHRTVAGPCYN